MTNVDIEKRYDALVIPGAGIDRETGLIYPWVEARFDAASLYSAEYLVALSRGTANLPPVLDKAGFPILESYAGLRYFEEKYGLEERKTIADLESLDSVFNFIKMRQIAGDCNIRTMRVFSNKFHANRIAAISQWCFFELAPLLPGCEIDYHVVPDTGMAKDVLADREAREKGSLKYFTENTRPNITSLKDALDWIHAEHGAYSLKSQKSRQILTGPVAKSY